MYKVRHLQASIREYAQYFKVVLIAGARQVGKSTLLREVFPDIKHFTFDMYDDQYHVRSDPYSFLRNNPPPLILDEVQYVPELLSALKIVVDQSDKPGQYFLTGSHNLSMLKATAESMAGRVGIIDLEQMTIFEQAETFAVHNDQSVPPSWLEVYLEGADQVAKRFNGYADIHSPMEAVWRGGFPGLLPVPNKMVHNYFDGYMRTYLERDVAYTQATTDLPLFSRFVGVMAALSAQEINLTQLGRELGIARAVAERWMRAMQQTYMWRLIPPYVNNQIKRVTRRGKGYLTDTGLACYLHKITDPETLLRHPMMGGLFETYCVNMVIRLAHAARFRPNVFHWRTIAGAEVDIVLAMNGLLWPIEIKAGARPGGHATRGIQALRETYGPSVQRGLILYSGTECYELRHATVMPFNALMK